LKKNRIRSAIEILPGVFHSLEWGQTNDKNLLEILIKEARNNTNRKARYCLHPKSADLLQVTYLAFSKPYFDKIHKHPNKIEVIIPIYGQANHITFDNLGKKTKNIKLDGSNPVAISTKPGSWHALKVISKDFVMIEIGTGPFLPTSNEYKN
jgi:cupin fold WbuC family metalloprotein